MEGPIKSAIPEVRLRQLEEIAKDCILSHGILARTVSNPQSSDCVNHHSVTMFPSPVPRSIFQQAVDVQKHYNLLMHRVAYDSEFLYQCLKSTLNVDDFTRRMWEICEKVRSEGLAQPISLALNRSDYMMDCGVPHEDIMKSNRAIDLTRLKLRQIEFNTIASSLGGISSPLSQCHRYMLEYMNIENLDDHLPENRAIEGQAAAMATAFKAYGNPRACVLFVVLDIERNIYDQRQLEYNLQKNIKGVKVIRRSIGQLATSITLSDDKRLIFDDTEIAIVYFRTCYTPDHYSCDKDWDARLTIERSRAIKCPNIMYQLAGTKKVQQMLATPGVVERYIKDPTASRSIRDTFAGQYSLDHDAEGDATVAMAMENPQLYVMKPQREGGGNNVFGDDIRTLLSEIKNTDERKAYIMMDKIHPAPLTNYALKVGVPTNPQMMVSEIGIYGNLVGDQDEIILNEQHGHLLRTKVLGVDEGGVATGFAFVDTAYLT